MEAAGVSSATASVEVEPVDGEEQLGQAAEVELGPAVARSDDDRVLDQVADDRVAAARRVEVRERVLHVNGPQLAVEVSSAASRRSAACRGTASR